MDAVVGRGHSGICWPASFAHSALSGLVCLHVLAVVLRGPLQASAVQSVTSVVRLP